MMGEERRGEQRGGETSDECFKKGWDEMDEGGGDGSFSGFGREER